MDGVWKEEKRGKVDEGREEGGEEKEEEGEKRRGVMEEDERWSVWRGLRDEVGVGWK